MSITSGGVWKPKIEFEICLLAVDVQPPKLNGNTISGICHGESRPRKLPKLVEEFLNWPDDPGGILKFTKKYGPVPVNPRRIDRDQYRDRIQTWKLWPGEPWEFRLGDWRELQRELRKTWTERSKRKEASPVVGMWHEDKLQFHRADDRIELQVCNLIRFLNISLHALPAERMRKCKRPKEEGCPNTYFIATHLRQEYCSIECAAWAQRAVKREWWKQRQRQMKGGQR